MIVNDFDEDLQYGAQIADEPFWQEFYKKAFPGLLFAQMTNKNCQGQQLGIDRVIYLDSGKVLFIDEKKRRESYPDILLEYQSNGDFKKGWMHKQLLIDYIAYAVMPDKKVFLFDWHSLRSAWFKYRDEWMELAKVRKDGFRVVEAINKYYSTFSLAIPTKILLEAINEPVFIDIE